MNMMPHTTRMPTEKKKIYPHERENFLPHPIPREYNNNNFLWHEIVPFIYICIHTTHKTTVWKREKMSFLQWGENEMKIFPLFLLAFLFQSHTVSKCFCFWKKVWNLKRWDEVQELCWISNLNEWATDEDWMKYSLQGENFLREKNFPLRRTILFRRTYKTVEWGKSTNAYSYRHEDENIPPRGRYFCFRSSERRKGKKPCGNFYF